MTQENRKLLLIDLSARLPYGVVIQISSDGGMVEASYDMRLDAELLADLLHSEDDFKPYLRPMNSMTDVEAQIYETLLGGFATEHAVQLIDWLNRKMFDYRGLIEKGLALETPEEMYKEE